MILHPKIAPLSNIKLKGSLNCIIRSTTIARGKLPFPNDNVQMNSRENYAHSYIKFIWLCIIESISLPARSRTISHTKIFSRQTVCQGIQFRSSYNIRQTILYEQCRSKTLPMDVSTLHTASYGYTPSYDYTYEDIFCAGLSPAQDIHMYDSTLHKTSCAYSSFYYSTYEDNFCASLSPAQYIPLYDSTIHKTSYASTWS